MNAPFCLILPVFVVSKLPEEHKDLEVFSGFIYSIRDLYKEDINVKNLHLNKNNF